jgi:hypothetical protein
MQFSVIMAIISICLAVLGWSLYLMERRRSRAAAAAAKRLREIFLEWKQAAETWRESATIWKETSRIWCEAAENYQRTSENWRELYLQQDEKSDEEELIN